MIEAFEQKTPATPPGGALPEPVQLKVEPPAKIVRLHVLIRLALLVALAVVGFSSLYWAMYLALPPLVALAIIQRRGGEGYLLEEGPRLRRALAWLAGAYGYLWLLTDVLPSTKEPGPVELDLTPSGHPTPRSAFLRLVWSLPALVLVVALSLVASVVWSFGAIWILVDERLPRFAADFLAFTLRYQFRFLAYHLSLVDRYPALGADS